MYKQSLVVAVSLENKKELKEGYRRTFIESFFISISLIVVAYIVYLLFTDTVTDVWSSWRYVLCIAFARNNVLLFQSHYVFDLLQDDCECSTIFGKAFKKSTVRIFFKIRCRFTRNECQTGCDVFRVYASHYHWDYYAS